MNTRLTCALPGVLLLTAFCLRPTGATSPDCLTITNGQVSLTHSQIDSSSLRSPVQGLWSIGTGWRDNAPTKWHHGHPTDVQRRGPWTILSGSVATGDGTWHVRDEYRVTASGTVQAKRRWKYMGEETSGPVVLSIRYQVDRQTDAPARPFLPGINYYGNPSGTRIDSTRVPTWSGKPGEEALYEEHRYPLPFAALENDGQFVAALHSRPSVLPFAARPDLWWSLGLVQSDSETELTLRSGPTASNGKRGIVKARQTRFLPYENAHLIGVKPDAVIEKQFLLQFMPAPVKGHGFVFRSGHPSTGLIHEPTDHFRVRQTSSPQR